MRGFGIVDVQQVVRVLLAAAEFTVGCKLVVVETVGVAQVVLREGVGPERLVARKRKHARRVEGICLVRRLECAYDRVFRLQVFVCGNVLDERPVDEEQFYRGGDGENASLVGDGAFPAENEQRYACNDEDEDESRNHGARGRVHHDLVERLKVRAGDRVGKQVLPAHEECADGGEPEHHAGFYDAVGTRQLGLVGVNQVGEGEFLALVVEVHHADAGDAVQDAGDKPDRSDERGPVVARDGDQQQEDGEHCGAVREGADVLGDVLFLVRNRTEYGARHHHEQEREPEQRHAGGAEILDAGENGIPELEERRVCAHAVAEGEYGANGPERGPATLAGQEQAEESEEGEERARVVVVELEAVVAPVERASGGAHLAVFVHGDVHERTALQVTALGILLVHVHADESRQEHLCEFFLVQGPADGVPVVGVVAFAADRLRGRVQVRRYQLEAGERKPEGEARGGEPDALPAGGERLAVECGFVQRVEPCAPQEEVRELQVASENHPRNGKREYNQVGEASVTDNLPDGEEGERRDGENHHLAVVSAVDVGEVFRREGVEEPEEGAPPAVAREVPGE